MTPKPHHLDSTGLSLLRGEAKGGEAKVNRVWRLHGFIIIPRGPMDTESELLKEMAMLDKQILEMIDKDPDLAEVYSEEMDGEQPGDVVYLPRSPTKEEWDLALKRSKQDQQGSE